MLGFKNKSGKASNHRCPTRIPQVQLNLEELESKSLLGETIGLTSLGWLGLSNSLTPWLRAQQQQQSSPVRINQTTSPQPYFQSLNHLRTHSPATPSSPAQGSSSTVSPSVLVDRTLVSLADGLQNISLNDLSATPNRVLNYIAELDGSWGVQRTGSSNQSDSSNTASVTPISRDDNSTVLSWLDRLASDASHNHFVPRNDDHGHSGAGQEIPLPGKSGNGNGTISPSGPSIPTVKIELGQLGNPFLNGDTNPGEAWEPYGPAGNPPGWRGYWRVYTDTPQAPGFKVAIAFKNTATVNVDYDVSSFSILPTSDPNYGFVQIVEWTTTSTEEYLTLSPFCDNLVTEGDETATAYIAPSSTAFYTTTNAYNIGTPSESSIKIHDGPACGSMQTAYLSAREVTPDACPVCNAMINTGANISSKDLRVSTTQQCACGANPNSAMNYNSNYDQTLWKITYLLTGGGVIDPGAPGVSLPSSPTPVKLRVQLNWDGAISTSDYNIDASILTTMPMDFYVQHRGATPGCHGYTITAFALDSNNLPITGSTATYADMTVIGNYPTEFGGPGWSLGLVDRLFDTAVQCPTLARGVTRTYGNGLRRVYKESAPDILVNDVDQGKLSVIRSGGIITGYVYRDTEGVTQKYNANGYMTSWISADGAKTVTFIYNGSSQLTNINWYDGSNSLLTYTGSGSSARLTQLGTTYAPATGGSTTTPAVYTFTYDGNNMLSSMTGPDNLVSNFSYTALTFPSGTYRYLSQSQYGSLVSNYQYDTADGLISLVMWGTGAGQTGTYTYTPMIKNGLYNVFQSQQFGSVKDPINRTTTYAFDDNGYTLIEKFPDGGMVTYTRNTANSDVSSISQRRYDPVGLTDTNLVTTFIRDNLGYPVLISYPDSTSESFTYTDVNIDTTGWGSRHLIDVYTNERGIQTKHYYDAVGHVGTMVYDPTGLGLTWKFEYSIGGLSGNERLSTQPGVVAYGNLITQTDAKGNVYLFSFDNYGRQTLATRPAPIGGIQTQFTYSYDAKGNLLDITMPDPDGTGGPLAALKTTYSYDGLGRVTGITEAQGLSVQRKTTFTYNTSGLLATVVDPLSRTSTYNYDSRGLVTQVTEPTTRLTKYLYDAAGQLLQVGLPRGFTYTYDYDVMGRVKQVTTPSDALSPTAYMTMVYDTMGWLRQAQDFNNNTTTYLYDNRGRVTTEARLGSLQNLLTTYVYDARGNVTSMTDPRGNTTAFQFDNADRLTLVTYPDPDGGGPLVPPTMAYQYDPNSNMTAAIDTRLTVTSYLYDALDRNTQIIRGANTPTTMSTYQITTISYNNVDQVNSIQRPGINTLTYVQSDLTYDNLGRVTLFREASNDSATARSFTYTYDAADRLLSTILPDPDAGGTLTTTLVTYTYDSLDRVTAIRTYKGASALSTLLLRTVSYSYDAHDNVLTAVDPLSRVTTFTYDVRDRLQTVMTPAPGISTYTAAVTTYQYDGNSNLIKLTQPDPDSNAAGGLSAPVTTYIYDEFNRLTQMVRPDPDDGGALTPTTFTYAYDQNGNQVSVTDPLNHIWTRTYDALNRVSSARDPLNQIVTYTYDQAGALLALTDPVGNSTSYSYDALGRLATETNALLLTRTYSYDKHDNMVSLLDRNNNLLTFSYDARDRKTGESWRAGPFGTSTLSRLGTYAYDALDRITNANDNQSNVSFTFDDLGRITQENTITKPIAYSGGSSATMTYRVTYSYDAADQRTGMTQYLGAGTTIQQQVTYTYDNLGRLKSETQLTYTAAGAANNGLKKQINFTYDQENRLKTVQRNGYSSANATITAANSAYTYDNLGRATVISHKQVATNIDTFTYTYDVADRLTSETSVAGWVSYTYQNDNQLSGATSNFQANETFSWDANGNPIGGVNQIGTNNRLNRDAAATYTYDQEGRRLTSVTATGSTTYSYDQGGRLTGVTQKNSGGTVTKVATYAYDSFGRRLGSTVDPDGATGAAAIQQTRWVYDGDNNIAQYGSTNTAALAINNRYLHGQMVDMVFADENIGTTVTRWTLTDIRGSVRDIANNSGTLLSRRQYNSFGEKVSDSAPAVDTIFGYTSREYDANANLRWHRSRYVDPKSGRFISEDAIGFAGGDANLTRYVLNSPTNAIDSSGQMYEPQGKGAVGNRPAPPPGYRWTWRWAGDATMTREGSYKLYSLEKIPSSDTRVWPGAEKAMNSFLDWMIVWWPKSFGGPAGHTQRMGQCAGTSHWIADNALGAMKLSYRAYRYLTGGREIPNDLDAVIQRKQDELNRNASTPPSGYSSLHAAEFKAGFGRTGGALDAATLYYSVMYTMSRYVYGFGLSFAIGRQGFLTIEEFAKMPLTGLVDSRRIRFSQNGYSLRFSDGGTVKDLTDALKCGKVDSSNIPWIGIVEKDGMIFSLDNRRLKAFQDAGLPVFYVKVPYDKIPKRDLKHFTTKNNGTSIDVNKR